MITLGWAKKFQSSQPSHGADFTQLDLCRVFNPVALVRLEPTPSQPSSNGTLVLFAQRKKAHDVEVMVFWFYELKLSTRFIVIE
jgi:hypothetical protein